VWGRDHHLPPFRQQQEAGDSGDKVRASQSGAGARASAEWLRVPLVRLKRERPGEDEHPLPERPVPPPRLPQPRLPRRWHQADVRRRAPRRLCPRARGRDRSAAPARPLPASRCGGQARRSDPHGSVQSPAGTALPALCQPHPWSGGEATGPVAGPDAAEKHPQNGRQPACRRQQTLLDAGAAPQCLWRCGCSCLI